MDTTIKVRRDVRDRLARLAQQQHMTMGQLLDHALRRLEREAFFAQVHAQLEALRRDDPQAWNSYRAESELWERATIADGLGNDDEDQA